MTDKTYVTGIEPAKVIKQLCELVRVVDTEQVKVTDALGRIVADCVFALQSVPHYRAAAMDGIAVRAIDTKDATESNPLRLKLGSDAVVIDTGNLLADQFDAVIMKEYVYRVDDDTVEINGAASPGQHVRPIGEDMVVGDLIVARGQKLRAYDIAALLAGGVADIEVIRPVKVAIIPTGDELVPPGISPEPGQIVETNSYLIAGLVREHGCEPMVLDRVGDRLDLVVKALQQAIDDGADVVVVNAGSSTGRKDYVPRAISEVGQLWGQGLTMRPGKPASFGCIEKVPVVGLPGYPVATFTVFDRIVKPVLDSMLGRYGEERDEVEARLVRYVASTMGVDESIRMRVGVIGDEVITVPLSRGAGATSSLVKADGLLTIDKDKQGLAEGSKVSVELLRPFSDIKRSLVCMGSHDLSLDVVDDIIRAQGRGMLQTAAVGSLGGIIAVGKGETHLGGCHLFDEASGEFNVPFVLRHIKGKKVLLITVAERTQGLIVSRGNPKGIRDVTDLARDDVTFINRQRGSGTRMLLDTLLTNAGIDPNDVTGYRQEEFTHTQVAAAVQGGSVDCGLGIYAAAKALACDFIPVTGERYELAVLEEFADDDRIANVIDVISSDQFCKRLQDLGGYDTGMTGTIRSVFGEEER